MKNHVVSCPLKKLLWVVVLLLLHLTLNLKALDVFEAFRRSKLKRYSKGF